MVSVMIVAVKDGGCYNSGTKDSAYNGSCYF